MAIKEEPKNLHHIAVFIASIVGLKFSVYAKFRGLEHFNYIQPPTSYIQ